jgi:hypothetical protein
MKHSSMSDYDADVIPMVEYFNSVGLKTYMSCSGLSLTPALPNKILLIFNATM